MQQKEYLDESSDYLLLWNHCNQKKSGADKLNMLVFVNLMGMENDARLGHKNVSVPG